MNYTPFEIQDTLESMVVLVDTREQDTPALKTRLEGLGCPYERCKLDYGDYACRYINPAGNPQILPVFIERKMSLDELCTCFTRERKRFENEFMRIKEANIKPYLLVENASWEKVFSGTYRSKLNPSSLIASILAWSVRYRIRVTFCKSDTSGKLIYKILYYELKEFLEKGGEQNESLKSG